MSISETSSFKLIHILEWDQVYSMRVSYLKP